MEGGEQWVSMGPLKCSGHPNAPWVMRWPGLLLGDTHSRERYSQLALILTLGAKICWDKVVAPKDRYSMNSEAIGIQTPPGRLPSQLPST